MLYLLIKNFQNGLETGPFGFLRVFLQTTFRAPVAVILSFLICLIFGPRTIRWLRAKKIGDLARFDQQEFDKLMASKSGTPTMGGLLIVGAIAFSTLFLGDLSNFYVTMALVCLLWLAAVGAADDWLKLTAGQRTGSRVGLTSREKLLFQVGLGVILSYFTYHHGADIPETHTLYFPFFKNLSVDLEWSSLEQWRRSSFLKSLPLNFASILFVIVSTLVITGTSNAVNLTDGLDGLASGCMAIVSFTFFILAILIGNQALSQSLLLPFVQPAGEMAVLAGAITGACLGFLWFNCNPAKVFMGDTGSLALGGLIAYIAIVIRQEIMLFIVGGIFVTEAISVLLQVSFFKYSRLRTGTGRRIFLMAPLHHHFQKKGWTETQVVVRFWLLGAMLAAMALATIRLR